MQLKPPPHSSIGHVRYDPNADIIYVTDYEGSTNCKAFPVEYLNSNYGTFDEKTKHEVTFILNQISGVTSLMRGSTTKGKKLLLLIN